LFYEQKTYNDQKGAYLFLMVVFVSNWNFKIIFRYMQTRASTEKFPGGGNGKKTKK